MPLTRISYWSLPETVRAHVEKVTGTILAASQVGPGLNSAVAALLHTPVNRYFIKALPCDHRWSWTQAREAEIAPHVQSVAPALYARVVTDGWDVLVFDALSGRAADYTPGSPDLAHVADLLTRIGGLACPDITLWDAGQRLKAYAEPGDLAYFSGGALLHTDWNSDNVIIGATETHIVDWGWATRGAPWLDAAYWIIWLIAAGHEPAAAEDQAGAVPAWRAAPAAGIDAFAAANARLWAKTAGPEPDAFTARLADAARRWHAHRMRRATITAAAGQPDSHEAAL